MKWKQKHCGAAPGSTPAAGNPLPAKSREGFGSHRDGAAVAPYKLKRWGSAVLLATALLPTPASAGSSTTESAAASATTASAEDLPSLRARAQQAHKALILVFGAKWCGPCQVFDRQVLPSPGVQQALAGTVFAHYDADTQVGKDAGQALGVIGYPTFIALGYDGREIGRLQGYREVEEFSNWARSAAEDAEPTEILQTRAAAAGAPPEVLLQLGRRRIKSGDEAAAEPLLIRAQQAATGVTGATSAGGAIAAAVDWELQLLRLRRLLRDAPRRAMVDHVGRFPASRSADTAVVALSRLGPADAATRQALGRYVDAHADASQQDLLNNAVYSCLKVGALDEAERGARRLLKIDGSNPGYLDTLAEVLNLRGDRAAALRYSRDAVAALGKATGMSAKEQQQTRAALLRNQLRFEKGQREPPAEFKEPDDALQPWER